MLSVQHPTEKYDAMHLLRILEMRRMPQEALERKRKSGEQSKRKREARYINQTHKDLGECF